MIGVDCAASSHKKVPVKSVMYLSDSLLTWFGSLAQNWQPPNLHVRGTLSVSIVSGSVDIIDLEISEILCLQISLHIINLLCYSSGFQTMMTGSAPVVHLDLPRPALLKPRQLWTGKQLLSAVVNHFAAGRPPLTFSSSSKVESRRFDFR